MIDLIVLSDTVISPYPRWCSLEVDYDTVIYVQVVLGRVWRQGGELNRRRWAEEWL